MTHLLITGAAGHVGRKLTAHFDTVGHDLTLLDIQDGGDERIQHADFSEWQDEWQRHFHDVDCVIHLAGCTRPDGDWSQIQAANLDATLHIMEAAAQAGVKRVVFASSNWVLAGHRWDNALLNATTPSAPVTPYGMSKLAGERIGRAYSLTRGLSVIALRIGYSQHGPNPQPGPHMAWGKWGQEMWLSDRDLCCGFECAVNAPDTRRFAVVNLVSNNAGMRWDLGEAERLIGYVPFDRSQPVVGPGTDEADRDARQIRDRISQLEMRFLEDRK